MTKDQFKYLGAVLPPPESSRFVMSIFTTGDENGPYFYQDVKNEKIKKFIKITTINRSKLLLASSDIPVEKGNNMVFSYIIHPTDVAPVLIFGDRNKIMPELLQLLYDDRLNRYSQLQIASFLYLYKKIFEYKIILQASYIDQEQEILHNRPAVQEPFILYDKHADDMITEIVTRYTHLKKLNGKITAADIAFMNKDAVYLMNFKMEYPKFFESKILDDSNNLRIFGEILMAALEFQSLDLHTLYENPSLSHLEKLLQANLSINSVVEEAQLNEKFSRPAHRNNYADFPDKLVEEYNSQIDGIIAEYLS